MIPQSYLVLELLQMIGGLIQDNERLNNECNTDTLTGIGNRRKFENVYSSHFAIAQRYGRSIGIIIFDIDDFKKINTSIGHIEADKVLQSVANTALSTVRTSDLCCRHGGEEFVVLLPETDIEEACLVAEKIRLAIEFECNCTISLGIASTKINQDDCQKPLLATAYKNMMTAKKLGKNCVFGFNLNAANPPLNSVPGISGGI